MVDFYTNSTFYRNPSGVYVIFFNKKGLHKPCSTSLSRFKEPDDKKKMSKQIERQLWLHKKKKNQNDIHSSPKKNPQTQKRYPDTTLTINYPLIINSN